MFSIVISQFFTQMIFTVGIVVIFGMILAFARRLFCTIIGPKGPSILLFTGIVGTPIHELGHALMCIIFGHKITDIKLFDPSAKNGVLGYVSHSYNPKNIYHQVGNFFIGVAPIICGSGVLLLLMRFMLPDMFDTVMVSLSAIDSDAGFAAVGGQFFKAFIEVLKVVFDFSYANVALWWVFIILALMISSHMEVSSADIKGGLGGLGFIAVLLFIADIVLYLINGFLLDELTYAMTGFSAIIIGFLGISAIFSLALIAVAFVVRLITSFIK